MPLYLFALLLPVLSLSQEVSLVDVLADFGLNEQLYGENSWITLSSFDFWIQVVMC